MPRYLWEPTGLPEAGTPEDAPLSVPYEPPERGKRGIRACLRRLLQGDRQGNAAKTETETPRRPAVTKQAEERVQAALAAWKDAERYFENVSDPELIGFAAYEMEAARRKYLFLLKNAHRIN